MQETLCDGESALKTYMAAENGHAEYLTLLLGNGGDPCSVFKGASALDITCQQQRAVCAGLRCAWLQVMA
jgi:hypothetical protein